MQTETLVQEIPVKRIPLRKCKKQVILNPASAGGKTRRNMGIILNALRREFGEELYCNVTRTAGEAEILARKASRAGCETVIAVGGDGTLQEVVNGFFENGRAVNPECRLGIIGSGTGRGFPLSLQLPGSLEDQIKIIRENRVKKVDVGKITYKNIRGFTLDRYFINECQTGIGGEVVKRVQNNHKRLGGLLAFGSVTVRTALQYREPIMKVTLDRTTEIEDRILGIVVANGAYTGGGMNLAPGADVSDGWFNVLIMHAQSIPQRLMNFPKIYSGKHIQSHKFSYYRAQHIAIDALEPVNLEADGELLGRPPCTIEMCTHAINVIYRSL